MSNKKTPKKHIVTSLSNLTPKLQAELKAQYPYGFADAMIRIDKPQGDFIYAVPFDTEEVSYMVKVNVKVDTNPVEEEDKGYYDDEIKGADQIDDRDEEEERPRSSSTIDDDDDDM